MIFVTKIQTTFHEMSMYKKKKVQFLKISQVKKTQKSHNKNVRFTVETRSNRFMEKKQIKCIKKMLMH